MPSQVELKVPALRGAITKLGSEPKGKKDDLKKQLAELLTPEVLAALPAPAETDETVEAPAVPAPPAPPALRAPRAMCMPPATNGNAAMPLAELSAAQARPRRDTAAASARARAMASA